MTLSDYDRRVNALPKVFVKRLIDFQWRNSAFLSSYSTYELAVCEQAVIIAEALKNPALFSEWWDLPDRDKKFLVPLLDPGITTPALQEAVNLAYAYLTTPDEISRMHGALCGMVGCRAYGCYSTEPKEEELVDCLYLEEFGDRKSVETNFYDENDQHKTQVPSDAELLVAYYSCESYEGTAFVLFRQDGVLYEVNASHCSCYGLEGQWEPEEVVLKELLNRPRIIPSYAYGDQTKIEALNARIKAHIRRVTQEEPIEFDELDYDGCEDYGDYEDSENES